MYGTWIYRKTSDLYAGTIFKRNEYRYDPSDRSEMDGYEKIRKSRWIPEKCQAAREAGCGLIVIGRPMEEDGISLVQTIDLLRRMFPDETAKPKEIKWHDETAGAGQVTLVGIGMGTEGTLTCGATVLHRRSRCADRRQPYGGTL